jgi:hypothetical protein
MSEAANSHLSGSEKDSPYNDPRCWMDTRSAPLVNLKKWQRRVDSIVGTTHSGTPRIRIVWAWDSWAELYGRRWQRYSFFTFQGEDISVPRFAVEQRIEPEQFYDAWESTRWQYTSGEPVDCGPAPREWWDTLWVIADHEGFPKENPKAWCCKRAAKMNRPCWGFYRHPSEWDVNEVARIHALKCRDDEKNINSPFKPLSTELMTSLKKAAFEKEAVRKETERTEYKSRLADRLETLSFKLSSDAGVRKHGRYHRVPEMPAGFKRSDSGLIVPDHN